MGFKLEKKTMTLHFDDEAYEGLEIVARQPSIKDALEGEKLAKKAEGKSQVQQVVVLFTHLIDFFVSWNLEDEDGNPLPLNIDTLISIPAEVAWAVFNAFYGGSEVSVPLAEGSDSTEAFPVESIPMETL